MRKQDRQQEILRQAADWASLHGLNDLTIGKLAGATGMSKAGLHGSFGSKTELQLSTIRFAATIFTREVVLPARKAPPGPPRARAFCENWLAYVDRRVFPGGCFFGRVSMEGTSLPAEVNAAIQARFDQFRQFLAGELSGPRSGRKPVATALERADQFLALVVSYNWAVNALGNARTATSVRELLMERLQVEAVNFVPDE